MISRFQSENPNIEVLGGINGDFYDINNTGHPSNLFIENYEVLKGVVTNNNPALIIREDGSVDITNSKYQGYEVLVINEMEEVVIRERIQGVNILPTGNNSVVLTSDYNGDITNITNKVLVKADVLRHTGSNFEFGKGLVETLKYEEDEILAREFVVVGLLANEIKKNHTVVVQAYHEGLDNVRGTMGGNRALIDDRVLINDTDPYQHPRTAVGIREDGQFSFSKMTEEIQQKTLMECVM